MNLPPLFRFLLWPFSMLYAAAMMVRAQLYKAGWLKQRHLSGKVISIGNLTVGGTGKTPMVIWLAERLVAEGKRVAILSRGYRGVDETSDEIEIMRNRLQEQVVFGVGKNRYAQGKRLESSGIDIFLLDDGFQHLQVARDVDIVLIDSTRSLQHDAVLPAGRLREPRSALHRADVVVFTRAQQSIPAAWAIKELPELATYLSVTKLLGFRELSSHTALPPTSTLRVLAFAGIGNPEAFFADLGRWGVEVVGCKSFRDHHRYTRSELQSLVAMARSLGAEALMTTEKDAKNLHAGFDFGLPVQVAVIAMELPDEERFMSDLRARLQLHTGAAA